jgi:NDP-mannose synthase
MKAIILAGGKGRRLHPFTTTIPKPLFPVGEKSVLQIIIEQLREAGITDITIAIGYLGELIEAYFRDGKKLGVSIKYSREYKPLGTAGPISLVDDISDDFLVMNGDVLTTMDYKDLLKYHKTHSKIATICCYTKKVQSSLGIVQTDSNNIVKDYLEKPITYHLVSAGIYCFKPAVRSYIEKEERIDLPDFIMRLKENGHDVISYNLTGHWFDIGTKEDLQKATEFWESRQ